ncbi:9545_t:CDS:2 [Acaulospora colombiana]|uniref:9545_t:CDS:1 n=1 Tax=Acaulospora colombiana TaxID=27376 RepID=A0ACA9LLW9_9GLOM|nr:9545_t:CDS:2 [Acaulospora colombiana]
MTNRLKNKSKGLKTTERLSTRASTRAEFPAKGKEYCPPVEGKADAEKGQPDSIDVVTPSTTVSTATTRSSSVDPSQQISEGLTKQKTRNCKNKKKVGTTSRKIAKAKQTAAKTIEIDYSSHSSDDADGLKVKREYRRKRNKGEDKAGYFKELRERLLAYKKKELEEEEATLKAGTHPKYVEEMRRVDEEYQKTRELQRQKRDHGFAHAEKEYEAGALQIRQQYVVRADDKLTADDVENDIRSITLDTRTSNPLSKANNAPQHVSMENEFRSRLSLSLQPPRSSDSTGNRFNIPPIFLNHGNSRSRQALNQQTPQSNNFIGNVPPPAYVEFEPRSRQSQNRHSSSSNINRISVTPNISNWNGLQAPSITQVNVRLQQAMPTNQIDEGSLISSSCTSGPPPRSKIIYGWLEKGTKGKPEYDR